MTPVFLYFAVYLLALAAGLPLGFALFGRRHAGGWIAGGLFGYILTALAIWAPIRLGVASAAAFAVAWALVAALGWILTRGTTRPLVALPPWTRRDCAALGLVWLLTLAIAVPPFWRVGEIDSAGGERYRAYFTADFVWHTALTAEMTKFDSPPRNPYLAHRPIHYYWTYFLLPAAVAGTAPRALAPVNEVESCLKVNAVGTALLFVSAIFLCAWTALPRAWPIAAGVALAIAASSAEGVFALWRLWDQGQPLGEVKNLNIDAITNWWFHGLRVDGLQRCFWWVPQHSMAYALGLVALAAVNAAGSAAPLGAIALAGLALAGSTMMNPFVGGIFSLAWGGAVAIDAVRSGEPIRRLARHAVAVIPVGLALAWVMGNRMAEGGGSALVFGWTGDARNAPVTTLVLALGPALACSLVGLLAPPAFPPKGGSRETRPIAAILLAGGSLVLLYFVRLDVDVSWVGFRAGQMFLVAVPALIARGFVSRRAWKRVALVSASLALLAGLPTTVVDVYNAQDVTNVSQSPIGPWTITITRDQQDGLAWLRQRTAPTAIVQMEPIVRDRSTWSLIPSFAQRRMAAGLPISLLGGTSAFSEYAERAARVKAMYQTDDAQRAWDTARSLRIDYLWVDGIERAAYPSGVAKFEAAPQFFTVAFRNADVSIYQVR
jgi:hypothetical protein